MKKITHIWFNYNNKSGYKTKEKWLKNHKEKLYLKIVRYELNIINNDIPFIQKIYNYIHQINDLPKCPTCNKTLCFNKNINDGYQKYCSRKCTLLSSNTRETNMIRYGVNYPLQNKSVLKKTKESLFNEYGVENPFKSETIKEKIKETNIKKYGVENPFKSKIIKEKIKETNITKYGVENVTQLEKNKIKLKNRYINNNLKKISNNLSININHVSYKNNLFIIKKHCNIHFEYEIPYQIYYDRVRLNIPLCTKCYPINEQSSIKEKEILLFFREELKINNIVEKDRNLLKGKEIDIFLPEFSLGIEFNGLYYHSDKFKDINYHLNKTEECKKQGIQLLHIFEDEWTYKKEIVKSIIKNKLNMVESKIYGRKTHVKEITDIGLVRDFLDNNHIQGFVGSTYKIGLFNKNELVSLMTFKKNKDSYELNRFCNKINASVIGGASKLLKYFIQNYKPNEIISFADKRYSNGNLYKKLNFIYLYDVQPSYTYFKNNELIRHHKFNFRKFIKENKSNESYDKIMYESGYYKIYDSGLKKYILNING